MRKQLLSLFLMFSIYTLFAQDIIYTISGELDGEKVPLDSILIENLSNNTWISFTDLPIEQSYQINLTKNSYWGTTNARDLNNGETGFIETINQPGEIALFYKESFPTDATINIYNLNGQKVQSINKKMISPGQSVNIKLGENGVFLVEVRTNEGAQTFKAVGSPFGKKLEVSVKDFFHKQNNIKSAQIPFSTGFEFEIGDTLRISVYKQENYASPMGLAIYESESLNFKFLENSDTTTMVFGVINSEELNNLNLSKLEVNSYNNLTNASLNGTFSTSNEIESGEQLPVLFSNGDDFLFGYHPEQDKDGKVDLDDILLFYFSLYPEIPIRGIELEALNELMQLESQYENLKLQLQNILNENKSPLDNSIFVQTLQTSAKAILVLNENQQKSTSDLDEAGHLQFNFTRDGQVTIPRGLPMFCYVGLEIKKDNNEFKGPYIFETNKLVISPSSIIGWLIDKIFEEEKPETRNILLNSDGQYTFAFSNGLNKEGISSELYESVQDKNEKLFIVNALSYIIPLTLEEVFNDCNQSLSALFTDMGKWLGESLEGDGDITTGKIATFLADRNNNIVSIIKECVPDIPVQKYSEKLLKASDILGKIETTSTIYLFMKDIASPIAGRDTINFYNNVAYTELDFIKKSEKNFRGPVGKEYKYDLIVSEKIDSFSIIRETLSTSFKRKSKWSAGVKLPFDINVIYGDAKIDDSEVSSKRINSSSIGLTFPIEINEEDSSVVTIKPAFELEPSQNIPDTVILKKLYPASLEIFDGNKQTGEIKKNLENKIQVIIRDNLGKPMEGATAVFKVKNNDSGEVDEQESQSKENGIAETKWKLGEVKGKQYLEVSIKGYPDIPSVEFEADAYLPPVKLKNKSGNNQDGLIGEYLDKKLEVEVLDKFDDRITVEVEIEFITNCNDCSGFVKNSKVKTKNGIASAEWRPSNVIGSFNLEARILEYWDIPKVTFTANIYDLPEVETNETTEIGGKYATLNGNVLDAGGATITERGFYYSSTDPTPDANDEKVVVSGNEGVFNTKLTGLKPGTTYYVRAFASNKMGMEEGGVEDFKTSAEPATLKIIGGNNQDGEANKYLDKEIVVEVLDENDNPVKDIDVDFVVDCADCGSVDNPEEESNADGKAKTKWKLGSKIGTQKVKVELPYYDDVTPVEFEATAIGKPTVSTEDATNVKDKEATLNGNIDKDGGSEIIEKGFYYSSSNNTPDSGDSKVAISGSLANLTKSGVDYSQQTAENFSITVTDLDPNTLYYFRAFASNKVGTETGNVLSFTTKEQVDSMQLYRNAIPGNWTITTWWSPAGDGVLVTYVNEVLFYKDGTGVRLSEIDANGQYTDYRDIVFGDEPYDPYFDMEWTLSKKSDGYYFSFNDKRWTTQKSGGKLTNYPNLRCVIDNLSTGGSKEVSEKN